MCRDRAGGNGFKLKEGRLRGDTAEILHREGGGRVGSEQPELVAGGWNRQVREPPSPQSPLRPAQHCRQRPLPLGPPSPPPPLHTERGRRSSRRSPGPVTAPGGGGGRRSTPSGPAGAGGGQRPPRPGPAPSLPPPPPSSPGPLLFRPARGGSRLGSSMSLLGGYRRKPGGEGYEALQLVEGGGGGGGAGEPGAGGRSPSRQPQQQRGADGTMDSSGRAWGRR